MKLIYSLLIALTLSACASNPNTSMGGFSYYKKAVNNNIETPCENTAAKKAYDAAWVSECKNGFSRYKSITKSCDKNNKNYNSCMFLRSASWGAMNSAISKK